jgi:hypothetical protein
MILHRILPLYILTALLLVPTAASAQGMLLAEQMQNCTTNEECILVAQTCATSCASLPINMKFVQTYTDRRTQSCGEAVNNLPVCNINPPMNAACINSRCTIDYAFQHNSHDGDYRNGGYQGSGSVPQQHSANSYSGASYTPSGKPDPSNGYVAPANAASVRSLGTVEMTTQPAPATAPVIQTQQVEQVPAEEPAPEMETFVAPKTSMAEQVRERQQGSEHLHQPASGTSAPTSVYMEVEEKKTVHVQNAYND